MQMQNRGETATAAPSRWQGRWMLILLVFFFSVSMVTVLLMHHFNWHPQTRSHGDLISPPRALHIPGSLMTMQGVYVEPELLKDKWSMVYVARECQQACEQRLHVMRQLHASLAKDIRRVQRILIASGGNLQAMHQQYPDLAILNHPESEVTTLRTQFDTQETMSGDNRIYLVDPLGNLMMSFSDDVAPEDIRRDLTRLLAYSWAG
ncbi:MAG TPA: hypothetical protein VFF75_01870 [Methylophilaceae bacterium]|nr:hypothetical protein [Methylophilaceae bacterium]